MRALKLLACYGVLRKSFSKEMRLCSGQILPLILSKSKRVKFAL